MKFFNRFFNLKTAVVDLAAGEAQILPLPMDIVAENLGGAALNSVLFKQYHTENPLVLGVGPLTGSFAPGSCLLVATFKRPPDNELCHTPLMLRSGPGLKFSGLDFLIIKGTAKTTQKLVITSQSINFLPAENLIGKSIPEVWQLIQRQHPECRYTAILTGPAADQGSAHAMVSLGTTGSCDRGGMAAWMAARKLKAIILEGGGGLPFEAYHLMLKVKMLHALTAGGKTKGCGCLCVLDGIGLPEAARSSIAKALKRDMACYNCPVACMGYAVVPWPERSKTRRPEAVVVGDHLGLLALAGTRSRECLVLFKECQHLGLDPVTVASALTAQMKLEQCFETIRQLAGAAANRHLSNSESDQTVSFIWEKLPEKDFLKFGSGLPPIVSSRNEKKRATWTDRVAISMILGICPILFLRFPEISSDALLEFICNDPVERAFIEQRLSELVQAL